MGDERRMQRVGAMWKPREGSKAKATGEMTINGLKQKFAVFVNDRKTPGSREPDFVLLTSEEATVDEYAQRRAPAQRPAAPGPAPARAARPAPPPPAPEPEFQASDDDVPFALLLAPLVGILLAGARVVA